MYQAYLDNEEAYWVWAEQINHFNSRVRDHYYYLTYPKRSMRMKRIEAVLKDYPFASVRDITGATRLCQSTVRKCEKLIYDDDPYWKESYDKWSILCALKKNPDDIYNAIEETYCWSKQIGVRTSLIEKYLPEIIRDIGEGLL